MIQNGNTFDDREAATAARDATGNAQREAPEVTDGTKQALSYNIFFNSNGEMPFRG